MSDSVPVKLLRLCPFGTAKCLSTSNHYQQTSCLTIVSSPLKQMFTSSSSIMSDKWNVINCCATISYSSFARIRSFPHLLIRSFVHSLILLKSNERLWAIHSDRSRQMSNRARIAHFAQIKWAMWANHSFWSPKMSDHERFTQVAQRKWANERFAQKMLATKT